MTTSEQALAALFELVRPTTVYPWKNTPSRRLRLWTDVPPEQRPALFQFEGEPEDHAWTNERHKKRVINVKLFAYTYLDVNDPAAVGTTQINEILAAIETALAPAGADIMRGRQTLGGLVDHCRIEGSVFKDPGDLDGDGLLIVPVKIMLP